MEVKVRIAPSPTGYFHIGTARTALFNWLFARQNKGQFILRIENTDLERSDPRYEEDIIESLKWLELDWDGDIYRQSDRLDIYKKHIKTLIDKDFLYHCFCSKEDLEEERQAQLSQGLAPRYNGKCRGLSKSDINKKLKAGQPSVLRLKIAAEKITFKDIIRGEVSFDTSLIGDIVVAKDEKTPLYNLAVVIDDEEMAISHVIRGEDHLANTPKQILLQEALEFKRPKYAHLPLILDPDRSKLSKRFSATAIKEYRDNGYLPEALINFMLLLGWHPQDEQEIFSRKEMIEKFDLERVQKSGAAFNISKLDWLNSQYIKKLSAKELVRKLNLPPEEKNIKIASLVRERMAKLTDFNQLADFFYQLPDYPPEMLIWKNSEKETTKKYLKALYDLGEDFSEPKIKALAEKEGRGEVLWPLRVALSGKEVSPGPFEIIEALGPEESLRRVKLAVDKLE